MPKYRISRYEIGGRIARGGMAEIYAARALADPGIAKRVALKKVSAGYCGDPASVQRFLDEARLAMRLSHANIVQVFDFGRTEEGAYFLAMEYVEGLDLKRLLLERPGERLPLSEAVYIAVQTLRGLDYAHRRTDDAGQPLHVVHRDVKPANLLLSFEGEVKLTDFGIARSRGGSQLSVVGDICGTIPFMSPEQAHGQPVDARSDVFSVGIVLYTMITGIHPFESESEFATLDRVRAAEFEPPSRHGLARDMDTMLARALARAPADRYPSAGAFADALEEFVYASALRSGASMLARQLSFLFPHERTRLNRLFTADARGEALAVAPAGRDGGYTQLSRVQVPARLFRATQAAIRAPRRLRRTAIALGTTLGAVLAAGGGVGMLWPRQAPPRGLPAPRPALVADAGTPPASSPASRPDVATSQSAGSQSIPHLATMPTRVQARARANLPAGASTSPGTLTVNANPWGNVYVNGRLIRATPLLRYPLRAGPATVTVENPKLGRRVILVRIRPNQDTPVIVDLRSREGPP